MSVIDENDDSKLTKKELELFDMSADLFNKFIELESINHDQEDFCRAIREIQRILAIRITRRCNEEMFKI